MTRLLLDRTLGILAGMPIAHMPSDMPGNEWRRNFVVVQPQLVGSEIKAWVVLSLKEFLDVFAAPEGAMLQ